MRGLIPLFLLFSMSSLARPSPTHLKDRPSNDAKTRLEELEDFLENREKDRERLFKKKDTSKDIKGNIPEVGELFEGDMIMDEDLRRAVLGEADKRDVLTADNKLWKNKVVPYEWDKNIAPKSKACLLRAMHAFHKHTCIKFVKKTDQKDYLHLRSYPNYCMSFVGKKGGRQDVHIGHGCTRTGTCEHELLHALGMIHEQSRPDRDNHVDIKWDNIKASEEHNFNKYTYNRVSSEGVPYNYASVMHYPNHAFAIDRSYPTIVSKKDPELIFGQRVQFSEGDVKQINRLYGCNKDKDSKSLVQTLSDKKIEEDMKNGDGYDDYQPLIF